MRAASLPASSQRAAVIYSLRLGSPPRQSQEDEDNLPPAPARPRARRKNPTDPGGRRAAGLAAPWAQPRRDSPATSARHEKKSIKYRQLRHITGNRRARCEAGCKNVSVGKGVSRKNKSTPSTRPPQKIRGEKKIKNEGAWGRGAPFFRGGFLNSNFWGDLPPPPSGGERSLTFSTLFFR